MSVYEATISGDSASVPVIQCVRQLTDLSLSDIRQRVADGVPVVKWDSDDYALDDDRETCHARILADIKRLRASGCELWFHYRPAPNNYLPYLGR